MVDLYVPGDPKRKMLREVKRAGLICNIAKELVVQQGLAVAAAFDTAEVYVRTVDEKFPVLAEFEQSLEQ